LLGALAYVLLLAIVAFGVPLGSSLSARVSDEVRTQAHAQADLIAATAADLLAPRNRPELWTLARSSAVSLRGRVIVVDRRGRVLVDSAGPAEVGASYASRPELVRALSGRPDQLERRSVTLGQQILATAVPVIHDGQTAGAVRVTQSVAAVHHAVIRVEFALALIGVVVLAVGLLVGSVLAAEIVRPLGRLEVVARRVAQGDLTARARIEGSREQKSLSRSFNEMTDRIVRLLGAQLAFVADASHHLRTPLTGLRLRLEAARSLAASSESAAEIDAALHEVDRLSATVDELLVRSRAGERRLTGTSVDPGELVSGACERWRADAIARGIVLACKTEGDPPPVWVARADVERALDALIENAVRYAPPDSRVLLAASPGRIEVLDRGPGVTPAERELVFERSRRGTAGRAGPPGHGLGLAIARELARGWGGDVELLPRRGGGTAAVISFTGPDSEMEARGE
jgi:signal transduction histidine kinase